LGCSAPHGSPQTDKETTTIADPIVVTVSKITNDSVSAQKHGISTLDRNAAAIDFCGVTSNLIVAQQHVIISAKDTDTTATTFCQILNNLALEYLYNVVIDFSPTTDFYSSVFVVDYSAINNFYILTYTIYIKTIV